MNSQSTDTFPVVILGAGLAGLTAALTLTEAGVPALVLEADQRWPGGRLAGGDDDTLTHGGQTWRFASEHGVHAVWGGYTNLRALLDRLGVPLRASSGELWINRWNRDVRSLEAGKAVRDRWLPAPFHYLNLLFNPRVWRTITPLDFLSLPGYLFSMAWASGFDPLGEADALDGLTMDDFFRGWTPNLRATFTGVGVNLLAAPAETISLSALIAALRFYTILRRDLWTPHFFPDNPGRSVIQPLIDRITAGGGQVRLGVTAVGLEKVEDGWRITVEDAVSGLRSVYAEQVILALHAPGAQRLLTTSEATAPAAAGLKFPGAVRNLTVRLWFSASPKAEPPGGMLTGHFEADNFFWLHRLYPDFETWHQTTGGSAVELHFYTGGRLIEAPDSHLIITAAHEISLAYPELKGKFLQGAVRRNSLNHTRFRVPTANSLHVVTPWEGLFACGDWVGWPTPSLWMERACVTGLAAANQVLTGRGLPAVPIADAPTPERGARYLGTVTRGVRRLVTPVVRMMRARRYASKAGSVSQKTDPPSGGQ